MQISDAMNLFEILYFFLGLWKSVGWGQQMIWQVYLNAPFALITFFLLFCNAKVVIWFVVLVVQSLLVVLLVEAILETSVILEWKRYSNNLFPVK